MSETNKYTVIELSEKLNVPRTTITDWLTRYSQYIDFKIQGKRKVYTDKSVEVLQEIKELRDKGLSSFDIEEELAKKHPIHGEFSSSSVEQSNQSQDINNNTQLISRNSEAQQIAETLRNMLLDITRRMDELEKQNRATIERTTRWNILAAVLIMLLTVISIAAFFIIKTVTEEKESLDKEKLKYLYLSEKLSSDVKKAENEKQELSQKVLELDNNRALLTDELEKLKAEIEKQKVEFELVLKNAMKDAELAKDAEILRLRDKLAEEKLKFLQELERKAQQQNTTEILNNTTSNNTSNNAQENVDKEK